MSMPALFDALIDDAAVFPPGSYPIDQALGRRVDRLATTDARFVGSFLVPPAMVERVLREAHPVPVVVIGRPGADLDQVLEAAGRVADDPVHALAGVQVGHGPQWQRVLELGVPVAIEVPAQGADEQLNSLVPQRFQALAKLRTGATEHNPVPTAAQLAAFITGCHERGLSFKLTGGMHHALTHVEGAEREFGFLNVLVATDLVTRGAAGAESVLDERDADTVVAAVRRIGDAGRVRDLFQSYGCCDVDDPIHELRALGLIQETL